MRVLLLLLLFITLMQRIYNYMPEQTMFLVKSVVTIYGTCHAISDDKLLLLLLCLLQTCFYCG